MVLGVGLGSPPTPSTRPPVNPTPSRSWPSASTGGSRWSPACAGRAVQPSRSPLPHRPGDVPAPAAAAATHPDLGRLHLAAPAAAAARRPPGWGDGRPADARRRPGPDRARPGGRAGRRGPPPWRRQTVRPGRGEPTPPGEHDATAYTTVVATWYLLVGWLDELGDRIRAGPTGDRTGSRERPAIDGTSDPRDEPAARLRC
jgi:hypothetical protein